MQVYETISKLKFASMISINSIHSTNCANGHLSTQDLNKYGLHKHGEYMQTSHRIPNGIHAQDLLSVRQR